MKNIIGRFILLIFVVLLLGSSAFAFDLVAIVVKSKTVVRQTPDSKGKVLLTAKKNQRFSVLFHKKVGLKL